MQKTIIRNLAIIMSMAAIISCGNASEAEVTNDDSTLYKMVNEDTTWVNLFDGQTLNGWHGYNKTTKVENWIIEDSALVCLGAAEWDTGGDLVTDREFENF